MTRLSYVVVGFIGLGACPSAACPLVGDTLTVIQRPILNVPAVLPIGDMLNIDCEADPETTGWTAGLVCGEIEVALDVVNAVYDSSTGWWRLCAPIPEVGIIELYDLWVAAGGMVDTTRNAVRVISAFKDDFYFIHITDTHLPTHMYHNEPGSEDDSSEVVDLREVIQDINIINPEFVLLTGDVVNEGDLENYECWQVLTRARALLSELRVPVYVTAGNHDLSWCLSGSPPGTSRNDWWRIFGWKRLSDPPPGAPLHTQNYSFDYGPVHFTGMEVYETLDGWRTDIYDHFSFAQEQMEWLENDLAAAGTSTKVLFYHYDFQDQIDLVELGVDMALWGHRHYMGGSVTVPPYDLITQRTCDGKRCYRLIKVSGGVLHPCWPDSAGCDGAKLQVHYSPPNDGTHTAVTAEIINDHCRRFEHALLRFHLLPGCEDVEVYGGTLIQTDTT